MQVMCRSFPPPCPRHHPPPDPPDPGKKVWLRKPAEAEAYHMFRR